MSAHTPGPWEIAGELESLRVQRADSKDWMACDGVRQIALVTQGDYEIPEYGEAEANARLIAAAPALLAACKLAQKWLVNCMPVTRVDGPKPLPVLAAAITQAEGRVE